MNPDPSDIIVLNTEETDTVTAVRGVWESPVGEGYTQSQAVRALKELCERAPDCYHCGPVRSVEHYSGTRYGRSFENRPLCEDCVLMLYEGEPEAMLGEPSDRISTVPVERRKEENHDITRWSA